ncbi:hypothetical protein QJS10_CPB15g00610 [Acorus calamus]|uniref:Uncharacterized protein n=1 Tax=Acorus calamus TaxID=4465 RepID=A0AAV9D3J2_ACOCL|nr:hypothetical protein QJS10_CPB15g00610 [Acorus calamus]
MGGCASKPRESDGRPASLPADSSKPVVDNDTPVKENVDASESTVEGTEHKEEPLVDLSEPKPEPTTSDGGAATGSKAAIAELVSEISAPTPEAPQALERDAGLEPNTENVSRAQHTENKTAEQPKEYVVEVQESKQDQVAELIQKFENADTNDTKKEVEKQDSDITKESVPKTGDKDAVEASNVTA